MNEILMYSGIALMGASLLCGVVSIVVFSVTGRRIREKLNREYGEKRR